MNWNKGYNASFYAYILDPVSWRETSRLNITAGSISRGSESLRESATITCVNYEPEFEQWVRVYLDAEQNGSAAHVPLFTGIATSPGWEYNGVLRSDELECYSVLKPAEDVLLERGYYLPAGINGAQAVKTLLSVCPCPIVVDGESDAIQTTIIAEDDETRLSMADKVLNAINWRLRIAGDGAVTICAQPQTEVAKFDDLENDSVELEVTVERDLFACPNVLQAISEDMTAIARDDNPNSILSTVSRGREVWMREDDCVLNTGESISEYAQRRLAELQTVALTASYNRRFNPAVTAGDLVRLNYPRQQLTGLFRVSSQDIELSYSARTSEEVVTR